MTESRSSSLTVAAPRKQPNEASNLPMQTMLFSILVAILLCGHARCLTTSQPRSAATTDTVVYDHVLPSVSSGVLHEAASSVGLNHKAFTRPIQEPASRPIIEQTLDRILTEMGDIPRGKKQYVEYWTRQEWRHIEAHADVDEHLAKHHDKEIAEGQGDANEYQYRYPTNGHVLYLKIGTEVRGPTCVFPGRSSGGDLLKNNNDDDAESASIEMVTVPAKDGRLLRFEGSALHAVPRPADIWFLPFVKGSAQFSPEEEFGRSVILFNTWDEIPPKGVPLDEYVPENKLSPGTSIDSLVNSFSEWTPAFGPENKNAGATEDSESKKAKIWLLGNERRRDYPMRTLKLSGNQKVREALFEPETVSSLTLSQ